MKKSALMEKSKAFALQVIKMIDYIQSEQREYALTKQVQISGTSIGANVHEAFFGQSLPDFISKPSIALKECGETQYWLDLLHESGKPEPRHFDSIMSDCGELGTILTASIKTANYTLSKREAENKSSSNAKEPISTYGEDSDSLEELLMRYSL